MNSAVEKCTPGLPLLGNILCWSCCFHFYIHRSFIPTYIQIYHTHIRKNIFTCPHEHQKITVSPTNNVTTFYKDTLGFKPGILDFLDFLGPLKALASQASTTVSLDFPRMSLILFRLPASSHLAFSYVFWSSLIAGPFCLFSFRKIIKTLSLSTEN